MCIAYQKDAKTVPYQHELLSVELTADYWIYCKFQQWALDYVHKPWITLSYRGCLYQKLDHTCSICVSNDTVSLMLKIWRFFFMLLFASCRTNMSGSSYLHLLSSTTNMSTTTVACDPSFPIFRAVSIIVKSAPSEHMEHKWSTSARLGMNRSLLLLCARNSDCLHWTSSCNWNATSIEPPVLLLWGSCSFVPDFCTHQRQSGIFFHTTC